MRRAILFFSIMCAVSFAWHPCGAQRRAALDGEQLKEMAAGLTPEGWILYDQVLQFTPDNLYEHIDGRAELYLAYNVLGLTCAVFEMAPANKLSISLSLYDMGSAVNAFGIFSVERGTGEASLSLGRAAYRSGANFYIWQGRYYVQIIASDVSDDLRQAGMALAVKVAGLLPDTGEAVWGLNAFPAEDLVADSVRYFLVDAFGLGFMRDTFTAQYRKSGALVTAFLSRRESPEAAQEVIRQYAEFAGRYGRGAEIERIDSVDYLVCAMKEGCDVIFTRDRIVCGVASAGSRSLALRSASALGAGLSRLPGETAPKAPKKSPR